MTPLLKSTLEWMFRCRSSFICQGTLTRIDLCGLQVKLPSVITSLTTQR